MVGCSKLLARQVGVYLLHRSALLRRRRPFLGLDLGRLVLQCWLQEQADELRCRRLIPMPLQVPTLTDLLTLLLDPRLLWFQDLSRVQLRRWRLLHDLPQLLVKKLRPQSLALAQDHLTDARPRLRLPLMRPQTSFQALPPSSMPVPATVDHLVRKVFSVPQRWLRMMMRWCQLLDHAEALDSDSGWAWAWEQVLSVVPLAAAQLGVESVDPLVLAYFKASISPGDLLLRVVLWDPACLSRVHRRLGVLQELEHSRPSLGGDFQLLLVLAKEWECISYTNSMDCIIHNMAGTTARFPSMAMASLHRRSAVLVCGLIHLRLQTGITGRLGSLALRDTDLASLVWDITFTSINTSSSTSIMHRLMQTLQHLVLMPVLNCLLAPFFGPEFLNDS